MATTVMASGRQPRPRAATSVLPCSIPQRGGPPNCPAVPVLQNPMPGDALWSRTLPPQPPPTTMFTLAGPRSCLRPGMRPTPLCCLGLVPLPYALICTLHLGSHNVHYAACGRHWRGCASSHLPRGGSTGSWASWDPTSVRPPSSSSAPSRCSCTSASSKASRCTPRPLAQSARRSSGGTMSLRAQRPAGMSPRLPRCHRSMHADGADAQRSGGESEPSLGGNQPPRHVTPYLGLVQEIKGQDVNVQGQGFQGQHSRGEGGAHDLRHHLCYHLLLVVPALILHCHVLGIVQDSTSPKRGS